MIWLDVSRAVTSSCVAQGLLARDPGSDRAQGRPFRENISENSALYYSLLGVAAVAINGATDFQPEVNRWLQLTQMDWHFRTRLIATMVLDYGLAWAIELTLKYFFGQTLPKVDRLSLVRHGPDNA